MNFQINKNLICTQKYHKLYENQISQTNSNSPTKPCCIVCERLWSALANFKKNSSKSPNKTFVPVHVNNQSVDENNQSIFISNELDYYAHLQNLKDSTELAIICESSEECEYIRSLPQQYIFNIDDWSNKNLVRWPFFDRENVAFFPR